MDLLEMNGGKFVFIGGRWWLVMVDCGSNWDGIGVIGSSSGWR